MVGGHPEVIMKPPWLKFLLLPCRQVFIDGWSEFGLVSGVIVDLPQIAASGTYIPVKSRYIRWRGHEAAVGLRK